MPEEDFPNPSSGQPRRGPLFVAGILVGVLVGAALAVLLFEGLGHRRPAVVKAPDPSEGRKDTVVSYVIHQYAGAASAPAGPEPAAPDTALEEEDHTDFMLDEEEIPEWQGEEPPAQVVTEDRMLKRTWLPITYMEDGRQATAAPAGSPSQWQVQLWSTPIRNRQAYQLSNGILKIQGVDIDNVRLLHYENRYYMVCEDRVYALRPNRQFDKLQEAEEAAFLLK